MLFDVSFGHYPMFVYPMDSIYFFLEIISGEPKCAFTLSMRWQYCDPAMFFIKSYIHSSHIWQLMYCQNLFIFIDFF